MTFLRTALAVAAMSAVAVPSASAAVPKDFVGIDASTTYAHAFNNNMVALNADLSEQRQTGIQIHRQVFSWQLIESSKGSYDFSVTDRYMEGLARNAQKVLPILFDAPKFYRKGGNDSRGIHGVPKSGKALGKFGAAIVKRYGPKGSFWKQGGMGKYRKRSAVKSVQIWNEPNLRYYWNDRPNARQYAKLLIAAAKQINKADKNTEIVTAGIPFSKTKRAINPTKFIAGMYRAGVRRHVDTLAFNAYANNVKDLNSKLKKIRKALSKAKAKKTPVWITEIGWASQGDKHPLMKGRKGQAREITKAIAYMKKNRKKMRLRGFVYYQWRDTPPYREGLDEGLWGLNAGLLERDGTPKPAHGAFQRAVRKL